MSLVQDIITQVRNYRAEEKVLAGQQIEATVAIDGPSEQLQTAATASFHEAISAEAPAIKSLARISDLTVVQPGASTPSTDTTQYVLLHAGGAEAHGYASARIWVQDPRVKQVNAGGIQWRFDLPTPSVTVTNRTKLEKELSDLLKQIDRLAGQLGNEDFRAKAPAEVRQRMENQQQAHLNRKGQLEELLAQMAISPHHSESKGPS